MVPRGVVPMYSSKWNTDVTKFQVDTISPCNWRVQRHNTMMISQMKRTFNGQQGSEDQDVWNHLFKEGVCEEVLPFIKIGPSRSGKWMMNDEWFHMKVLISYKTNGKPALYHFIFSKWILNQVSLFCHAPQKIDDVNVSKVSTSHQFFFCQKVDIEFCQSFAKFGNVSIQEISYFGFYGGGWISLPLPRKQQKALYNPVIYFGFMGGVFRALCRRWFYGANRRVTPVVGHVTTSYSLREFSSTTRHATTTLITR